MTPQQIRNEVEKEIKPCSCQEGDYCIHMVNKAKLSILTEYDKSIKEELNNFWNTNFSNEKLKDDEIIYCSVGEWRKLLSKIGDNSEVEK